MAAPDGTAVFLVDPSWLDDFVPTRQAVRDDGLVTGTDHVSLTESLDDYDEAAVFYRTVLGLRADETVEVASLVRAERRLRAPAVVPAGWPASTRRCWSWCDVVDGRPSGIRADRRQFPAASYIIVARFSSEAAVCGSLIAVLSARDSRRLRVYGCRPATAAARRRGRTRPHRRDGVGLHTSAYLSGVPPELR